MGKYRIQWYDTLDSTNSEAVRRLEELDNMSVIAARSQTAGRGKDTNKWLSSPGENLTFTVVLKYEDFPAVCQMAISAATAAAVVNFLSEQEIDPRVKWPNDIYVGNRKICGILIEHRTVASALRASVIGVGVNLNQTVFPSCLPNPVSVAQLTGKKTDVEEALERFCEIFSSKMDSVFSRLPHLSDVIRRAFAAEDGAAGDENIRSGFAQCIDILL